MATKKKIRVFKTTDEAGAVLEDFDAGDSEVEVHVDTPGLLFARRIESPDYTCLGDTSKLDAGDVEALIDHYLCKGGDDIASMACAIREEAKVIEAMAMSEDWGDCEATALSILATVHETLVALRHKRDEE